MKCRKKQVAKEVHIQHAELLLLFDLCKACLAVTKVGYVNDSEIRIFTGLTADIMNECINKFHFDRNSQRRLMQ